MAKTFQRRRLFSQRSIGRPIITGIAFDAVSTSGVQVASASYNWNHTTAGSNRALVVKISILSVSSSVSGITYNGVALTLIRADTNGVDRTELWGLLNPTIGTNAIAVTLSGAITSSGAATSYAGVDQTTGFEAHHGTTGTNTPAADSVTTLSIGAWVVGGLTASSASGITSDPAQVSRADTHSAAGSGLLDDKGPIAVPASTSMTWTGLGGVDTWAVSLVALAPVHALQLITPSGIILPTGALVKLVSKAFSGSITPVGALAKQAQKPVGGALTPTGTLTRQANKAVTGTIAPAGALGKAAGKVLAGALTPVGAAVKACAKALSGALVPVGNPARAVSKALAGALTPSGALSSIRVLLRTFTGALTPTGALARQVGKGLTGQVTPAGALVRAVSKALGGTLALSGGLAKFVAKVWGGVLALAGALGFSTGVTPGVIEVTGTYTPSLDVTGTYRTTLDATGTSESAIEITGTIE